MALGIIGGQRVDLNNVSGVLAPENGGTGNTEFHELKIYKLYDGNLSANLGPSQSVQRQATIAGVSEYNLLFGNVYIVYEGYNNCACTFHVSINSLAALYSCGNIRNTYNGMFVVFKDDKYVGSYYRGNVPNSGTDEHAVLTNVRQLSEGNWNQNLVTVNFNTTSNAGQGNRIVNLTIYGIK